MRRDGSKLLDRRAFLRTLGIAAAGAPFVDKILAGEQIPLERTRWSPVRIRGTVRVNGSGLGRVAVSDGRNVAVTHSDGTYELVSESRRPYVFVSLPAGTEIPVSARGSSALYRQIVTDAGGEATAVFDLKRPDVDDRHHGFLVLADPQTLDKEDMLALNATTVPDVRKTTAALPGISLFGVGCGDLMFDHLELFPDYEEAVKQMAIPFFQVLGNHDVNAIAQTDDLSTATFLRTFGPANYSFNRGEVHYVVLDDVLWIGDGYIGYLTQEQIDWLRADLQLVEKGRTVVVFVHIPVYCTQHIRTGAKRPERTIVVTNRQSLYDLLAPYRAHVVAGHMHESEHLRDGNVGIHVSGAVCGAWWTGPICGDGTPNGYAVYEVNGEEIRWRYKVTGSSADDQMRLYDRGTDAEAPRDIVANVWDWDPSWKIVWYEDGIRKGEMAQRRGLDPLAVKLHKGVDRPRKHTWVEPYVTDHLFRAEPSPSAREVLVEATDGFRRVYTAKRM